MSMCAIGDLTIPEDLMWLASIEIVFHFKLTWNVSRILNETGYVYVLHTIRRFSGNGKGRRPCT